MMGPSAPVIVAFDHAALGLLPGLDRIEDLAAQLEKYPIEGYIVNYGLLKRLARQGDSLRVAPIARLDGNQTFLAGDWTDQTEWELLYSIDDCRALGARGAVVNLLLGGPAELPSIKVVAKAAVACQRADLPLLVSAMCLCKQNHAKSVSHNCQAFSARIAYELGADRVIVYNVSDERLLKEVTRWCPLPLYTQGGVPQGTSMDLSQWAKSCLSAGASGIIVGRAVWQNPDPYTMIMSLIEATRPECIS
jgi:DhnA family fructose-bisphosphate aldolase class Ia